MQMTARALLAFAFVAGACAVEPSPTVSTAPTSPAVGDGPREDGAGGGGGGGGVDGGSKDGSAPDAAAAPKSSPLRRRLVVNQTTVSFVREDGAVFRWGQYGTTNGTNRPVAHEMTGAIAIALSDALTMCSLQTAGTVQCWNFYDSFVRDVDGITDAVGLAGIGETFCAQRKDQTLVCFDTNDSSSAAPVALGKVTSFDVVGDASPPYGAPLAFKVCGVGTQGISCITDPAAVPALVPGTAGAKQVVHDNLGRFVFIDSMDHATAYEDGTNYPTPKGTTPVAAFENASVARIERHGECAITQTGTPYCVQEIPPGLTDVVEIGLGYDFGCALTKTEKVLCWGKNDNGQLGVGSYSEYTQPVEALVP
jgi:hypothetical protein